MRHNLFFTAKGTHRHTASDHLTQACEIRVNAQVSLGTVCTETKPRHDFVKDEDRTVLCAQLAHALEETWLGENAVHVACYRLGDDAGNIITQLIKRFL